MIAIGSDHDGVELKDYWVELLRAKEIAVCDSGATGRRSVDYPDYRRLVSLQNSSGDALCRR
jgi:ribose 5-phosphate isomerase RpiB